MITMAPSQRARTVALGIARCRHLASARSDSEHHCHPITSLQQYGDNEDIWQVPEPWRGDIECAPLLFVSSNPSIDPLDDCPWNTDDDDDISSYYTGARIAPNFPYSTYRCGLRSKKTVKFWTGIHARAQELFARPLIEPGTDYAVTEIVHCKSRDEAGVDDAASKCAETHLASVLNLSSAVVIVCLGNFAEAAVRRHFGRDVPGLRRPNQILELPHPNAHKRRKAVYCLAPKDLQRANELLSSGRSST